MPFILPIARPAIDKIVKENWFFLPATGHLNYFLCKLMLRRRKQEGESYQFYKCFCAELEQAAKYIKDHYQEPYEMRKKEENGDIE